MQIIHTQNKDFEIIQNGNSYDVKVSVISNAKDVEIYEVTVKKTKEAAGKLTLKWANHMRGILSTWSPVAGRQRFIKQAPKLCSNTSNLYFSAPVMSVINQDNTNFSTVAVSDAINPITITFNINDFEQKENLYYQVIFFDNWEIEDEYKVYLRIDERNIPYYEAIPDVTKWWHKFYPLQKDRSENGELPLYSTWYNYHQNPIQDSLLKELEDASSYGFKSVIIDDGWSYPGTGPGDYRLCGNWNICEEKFPDFKAFVNKLHDFGLKVSMWFPVPFVGYDTEEFKKFKDYMYYNGDVFKAGILDPRYSKVRSFIVETYKEISEKYDLDGLKLDFIDSFRCKNPSELCNNPDIGRDCDTIEQGVIKLMSEISEELSKLKKDFMIEQRQYYVGPAIVHNCNMLRVLDCPFDLLTNRMGIADLRLLNYDLAVHADMLLWSHDEDAQTCAKMLYNIMFGVPQISLFPGKVTAEQKMVLKNYIDYWYYNREVILHGKFKAFNPQMNYTKLSSENDNKRIEVLYSDLYTICDGKDQDIFNATSADYICVENISDTCLMADVYDWFGNFRETVNLVTGVNKILLQQGGYITVKCV